MMHWPLAGLLLTIGLLFLSLFFLPVAIANMVKKENDRKLKVFYILAAIVMAINFIGALFKIMHWQGAGIIMMIAIPLPFIVLLPVWVFSNRAVNEINWKNVLAVMFFFAYFAAISSILALRVSFRVVEDFSSLSEMIESKTEALKEAYESDHENKAGMNPVHQEAEELYKKISEIRQMIQQQVNESTPESQKTVLYSDVKPSIDLQYLTALKTEVIQFKSVVQKQYGSDSRISRYMEEAFSLYSDPSDAVSWEELWINSNIIASAMENLNMLEYRVRLVELELNNPEINDRSSLK